MKNLKQIIANSLIIVFAIMMLDFGGGYYFAGQGISGGISGYKYLHTLQERLKISTNAKVEVYFYIAGMIMFLIFVSLLIVLAVLSLLCNLKVIKSEKVNKLFNIFKLVLVVLVLISIIFVLASVLKMLTISTKLTTGYGLVINVILATLTVVVLVVDMILARKKA